MATSKRKSNSAKTDLVRLNKYIADCGIASRRKADELIDEGMIKVNGRKVFELGVKVNPAEDVITYKGKRINASGPKVYYMLNKPLNVLTSMSDPEGRPTVGEFFGKSKVRLFPVGRLDWDTEGLLLMTNDGEFANTIASPKEEITKSYMVKLNGQPTDAQLAKLKKGVSIIGGKVKAVHVERIKRGSDKYDWVQIVITEGKNRQVRKMFEKIGYDVTRLKRIAIGGLKIGALRVGQYRELKSADLLKLFKKRPDASSKTAAATAKKKSSSKRAGTQKPLAKKKSPRKPFKAGKKKASSKRR